MRKNLREKQSNNTCGNENPAGCVWGILHIIKYHHWHYIKKRLVHKRRRHHKHEQEVEDPGKCANASVQEDTNPSIAKSTEEGAVRPSIPTGKTSVKDRIKARIAVEISKKRGRHHRSSSCPVRSELKRTESIHRFEPPDPIAEMVLNEASPRTPLQHNRKFSASSKLEPLPETSYEELNSGNNECGDFCPRFTGNHTVHDQVDEDQKDYTLTEEKLDNDTMRDILDKKLIHVKELDTDASLHRPKEYLEALDIINVNKELLVKILHDPGSPLARHFNNQHTFGAKMALSKSETFPFPRDSEPMMLRYKHELIGSPSKEDSKSKNRSQARMLSGSSSLKSAGERAMPPVVEYSADGIIKINQASRDYPALNRGENQVAIRRFKDLRQKIKHVIRESKKERHMIAMDAILHRIPHGQKLSKEVQKEIINHSNDPNSEGKESPISSYGSDYSVSPIKKKPMRHMRRTSSVFASLDRYCQLYETSRNREGKCHTSERLNLRTERVGSPLKHVQKKLGRISSLPEMKSYNYQNEEPSDAYSPGTPIRTDVDGNKSIRSSFYEQNSLDIGSENYLQLEATIENKLENSAEVGEVEEVPWDKVASTSVVNNDTSPLVHLRVQNIKNLTSANIASQVEQGPDSNVSLSEGPEMELEPRDELDDLAKQWDEPVIDTPNAVQSEIDTENVASPTKHLSYDMPHFQVDARDMAEFNYVRDVLAQSGFSGSESLGTWHSDDQPVDPLMYGDADGCLVHDPDCSGNEGGKCEHFFLFDLINEVLMEIYGRSYNYCPIPLSSLCRIPPMPAGHHVLKEVWALISWYLSLRPEVDQSLDYVMSRDLAKNDGWMNLQFDSECIGLELEDLIFDELLEEAICA